MLTTLANLLREKADDLDAGNSNISEEKSLELIDFLNSLRTDKKLTRTQAAKYLRWSLSKFDRAVRDGKLPKGRKVLGGTPMWLEKDLLNYVKSHDN